MTARPEEFLMSDPAHPLTLWLARGSMVCYALALIVVVSRRPFLPESFRIWRSLWSGACVLLLLHVLAAFHFEHGWSHSAAWNHTSDQTARVTGIVWGGGLYFNYAFLICWIVDIVLLWRQTCNVTSTWRRFIDLTCVFMVVNATIVFGPSWWIWPALAVAVVLIVIERRSLQNREATD